MVTALLLASCASAVVEEEEEVVTPEEEEVVVTPEEEEEVTPTPEKPRYGGELNLGLSSNIQGFDECFTGAGSASCTTLHFTNEELLTGDWTKGPIGTSEASWLANEFFPHLSVGCLAESWEVPDSETIIYHIRKGVYFHDKPPVNGRELTADDVAFSINRQFEITQSYAYGVYRPEEREARIITAPDKWTVIDKWLPGYAIETLRGSGEYISIMATEVAEEYGDFRDWKNSVGTGPFMLIDFVDMSSATFVRNPDYWRKHPIYGDQMPYLDGIKMLIIPDLSTRISALRTGKIDVYTLGWEDAESVIETTPELKLRRRPSVAQTLLHMRVDKPELPFSDIRVRQALALAVNNREIADTYYGGNAELVIHPIAPLLEFQDMYTPLEELPEVIRELYGYHPEKAKQLLAEAGYPDGFETTIICSATSADLLSIVKSYWEKIGVTLNIEPRDTAVYLSIAYRRKHEEMITGSGVDSTPRTWNNFAPENILNRSLIDDSRVNEAIQQSREYSLDWDKLCQIGKETYPYILEQCWAIPLPTGDYFTFWWPWVKDYQGEGSIGFYNSSNWAHYIWYDQELKKAMGY